MASEFSKNERNNLRNKLGQLVDKLFVLSTVYPLSVTVRSLCNRKKQIILF